MQHAKRATVEVDIEWHEDDVGGNLDDLEHHVTHEELKELVVQHIEYANIRVTWHDVTYE